VRPSLGGRIVDLKEIGRGNVDWIQLAHDRVVCPVAGYYEYDSVKLWIPFDQLSECHLLKEDCAPYSWLVVF
jgi:hypothetical protein